MTTRLEDDYQTHTPHTHIRNIVNLVKNGQMKKTEAFHELRTMLTNSDRFSMISSKETDENNVKINEEHGEINGTIDFASNPLPSSTTPRFSKEDRRLLINKLIDPIPIITIHQRTIISKSWYSSL